MFSFFMVLLISLALSLVITRFFIILIKQTPSKPGLDNVLDVFKKPPYIYLIAGILLLIFFKLMYRALTFIVL